jgi:hypothetical protein
MLTKYNVSEIGFYLRPQVRPTQLGPIGGPEIGTSSIYGPLPEFARRLKEATKA